MAFVLLREHDYEGARAQVDHLKALARDEFGRSIQVWFSAYVAELNQLSRIGLDGCVLSWVNYPQELRQWVDEALPVMEQAGLRKPL